MPKKLAGGPAPDLEDAFDVSRSQSFVSCFGLKRLTLVLSFLQLDDVNVEDESSESKEDDNDDISKDSLIKQAKGKGKATAKTTSRKKS